jgi:hypothetical protein
VGEHEDHAGAWPTITVYVWHDERGQPAVSFEAPMVRRRGGARLYRVPVPIPRRKEAIAPLSAAVLEATQILDERKQAHNANTQRRMAELAAMTPEQREAERSRKQQQRMKPPPPPPSTDQQERLAAILDRQGFGRLGPPASVIAPRFGVNEDTIFVWEMDLLAKQRKLQEILAALPMGRRPPTTETLADELDLSPVVVRRWRSAIAKMARGPGSAHGSVRAVRGGLPTLGKRR